MNIQIVYILCSVLVVSSISLIGVLTLACSINTVRKITLYLVSLAVGALLGDAVLHLMPASFEHFGHTPKASLLILSGILLFFVLEKFLRWRHCHEPTSEEHLHPVAFMNIVGDGAHNFIDGMLIASSFMVDVHLGVATTIAIVLHEIPQEIGDFGILLHAGMTPKKALMFNLLSSLAAVLGAVFAYFVGCNVEEFAAYIVPITAGSFIYMAGSDLIPELHHDTNPRKSVIQLLMIVFGIVLMLMLSLFESAHGTGCGA